MKPVYLLIILIAGITLQGCHSKEQPVVFSGVYASGTTGTPGSLVMYTKQGIITDTSTIKGFLQRQGSSGAFYFNTAPVTEPDSFLTINFISSATATLFHNIPHRVPVDTATPVDIVDRTTTQMNIRLRDTLTFLAYSLSPHCDSLAGIMRSISGALPPLTLAPAGGGTYYARERTLFPLTISGGQLFMPLTTFCWISNNCYGTTVDNTLPNTGMAAQMQASDTVVCQTVLLSVVKQ